MIAFVVLGAAIGFAPADQTIVRVPSAADAWGGERERPEQVVTYRIEAELDAHAQRVSAQETMTWLNRSDVAVDTIYLHLYLNAFAGDGSLSHQEEEIFGVGGRGPVEIEDDGYGGVLLERVSQGDIELTATYVHPDGEPSRDLTVVAVQLARPVPPHERVTVAIAFTALLPKAVQRSGYHGDFFLVAQWFPKIGVLELAGERGADAPRWNVHAYHFFSEFYADFAAFDVALTVPDGFQVAAVGTPVDAPHRAQGQTTFHFGQEDVHDFAWMATPTYAPPLHGMWRDQVSVDVYFPEEYRASAERCLETVQDGLDQLAETLMPYPYRSVSCVVVPFGADESLGGMEYPTFFTTVGDRSLPPRSLARYVADTTVLHELVHGYFYGIVASNEFEEPMLDEGLTSFWEQRFRERRHLLADFTPAFFERFGLDLHAPANATGLAGDGSNARDPLADSSWHRRTAGDYFDIYGRTPMVLEMIDHQLAPGELEQGMRDYVRRWRFRHPSIADLEMSLAEATTRPEIVHAIFTDFVYTSHVVDDRVVKVKSVAREDGFATTVLVERNGAEVPQALRVTFEDGSVEDVVWPVGERWHRFAWQKTTRAQMAQLDPDGRVTLDRNKLDNMRVRTPHNGEVLALWRVLAPWVRWLMTLLVLG